MRIEQYQWFPDRGWNAEFGVSDKAQIAFVFGSLKAVTSSDVFQRVRDAYPAAHAFGCTTAGEIHGQSVDDETVSVSAVKFEHSRVTTSSVSMLRREDSFMSGEKLAQSFAMNGLKHVFVLSVGIEVDGSELVAGVNSRLPDHVTVSGGLAGDFDRIERTLVWCDGIPMESSVVAVGFYGEQLRVGLAADGGWDPFGPERLVTRSVGNVLYELDGRSALALYKQYLGEHAAGLPTSGLLYPLGLSVAGSDKKVLRSLISVDEEQQSLTFAGDVPERSMARLHVGNVERLTEGASRAAAASTSHLGGVAAEFAILVSCYGRRPILRQLADEEVEAAAEGLGDSAKIAGFYSYGEICPAARDHRAELHNQTMTITSFAEL